MNSVKSIFFSSKTALVLLVLFSISMAIATFIENDHGTQIARALVYESWWFEIILLWLSIVFLVQFGKYKLLSAGKWPVGVFHVALLLILAGAAVTRYFGNEGLVHIREGQKAEGFLSQKKYFQFQKSDSDEVIQIPLTIISHNFKPLSRNFKYGDIKLRVEFDKYIARAETDFVNGNDTLFHISAIYDDEKRENFILRIGESIKLGNLELGTTGISDASVRIFPADTSMMIISDRHLHTIDSLAMGMIKENELKPLLLNTIYQWEEGAFMVSNVYYNASLSYRESGDKNTGHLPDAVRYSIYDREENIIFSSYAFLKNLNTKWESFSWGGDSFHATYGPKYVELPFSIELKKFDLQRYPGSQSPSGYASEVIVHEENSSFPYRIFMNNVLDHRGYRFYQSSYDKDEKGTILSVNQDRPGTLITYSGYFFLALGMFLAFFAPGGRFRTLNRQLQSMKKPFLIFAIMTIASASSLAGQTTRELMVVPKKISDTYGSLLVQDIDGRIKPLNTLANEIARKIHGNSRIKLPGEQGSIILRPEQFLLALQLDAEAFLYIPLIKTDRHKAGIIFETIGKSPADKIAFMDLLADDGSYLLHKLVEEAYQLKPSERNSFQTELMKLDERFNIFYGIMNGDFLKMFPNKLDENNTWFTGSGTLSGFEDEDARFVAGITPMLLNSISEGIELEDFSETSEILQYISIYQEKAGASVYPGETRIKAELLYNKLNIGNRLFGFLWLLGALLMLIAVIHLFSDRVVLKRIWISGKILAWAAWVLFTFHLLLRWYIAQYPPWSDGFEMLVFVAWGVLLSGTLFSEKSAFTLPSGLLFSGTLLFVSFLDWLNPEITNLVPVLNSYWLKIHVSVIVLGYAPLALSAFMSLLALSLLVFRPGRPSEKWWINLRELRIVNEMAVLTGLFLFTTGTFLGGVWANESWGRYWAWDPKETWALITIVVYSIVLHFRLIPALRNYITYNLAILWGFSSVIMTSFGVNYYLSGLHSYAAGDPVPIPVWVYWVVIILLLISGAALINYRRLSPEERLRI